MRNYSASRAAIFPSPLSPAFDPFLYQALFFSSYLQPLSLLFPTSRRSALPGENTAVGESSYGPDWHCGTLLGHSHSLGEVTAPSQRQAASHSFGVSNIQLSRPFLVSGNRPCVEFLVARLGLSIWWRKKRSCFLLCQFAPPFMSWAPSRGVPGVDVMAKRPQGWVQCEDRLPYYNFIYWTPRLHDARGPRRGARGPGAARVGLLGF
jgi:hypothetical protein